ncbi:MAG: hypothetical protein JW810_11530 [Sedimentisphaerales bacterium]|nr:hypothetical protein [Sedimentisphaerales bacterium]
MRTKRGKWIATALLVAANAIGWAIPSDIAYLVAQQRDVLLGRYSLTHLTWLLAAALASGPVLYLFWANQKNQRKRRFQMTALGVSVLGSLAVVDVAWGLLRPRRYVRQEGLHHRMPHTILEGINRDVPPTAFSYPRRVRGYPDIRYRLTVDARGFRNPTKLESCEIAAIGDSFTEGSGVSDDQVWPILLAEQCNRQVYNLGVSAGNPRTYRATLSEYGLALKPQTVICMLYEGNDFRASNFDERREGWTRAVSLFFKQSPLRQAIKTTLIRFLGPVGSGRAAGLAAPGEALHVLSWLPLDWPPDKPQAHFTFEVKDLLAHDHGVDEFRQSSGCQKTLEALRQMQRICQDEQIRLLVVYAPDTAHVVLPVAETAVPADLLRRFVALKQDDLPEAEAFKRRLLERLAVAETVLEEFCREQRIEFVSLTGALQQAVREGRQAYFTYDQHWTPIGQRIAADVIQAYLYPQEGG